MWTRNMTGSEQLVRILLALAFIGFSSQEHTTLIQVMAGYVVGGILLTNALFAQCATTWKLWKLLEENSPLVPFKRTAVQAPPGQVDIARYLHSCVVKCYWDVEQICFNPCISVRRDLT
jgi:hypothetical protein